MFCTVFNSNSLANQSKNIVPFVEFPCLSKGGLQTATPILLGTIIIVTPVYPDFAGNPFVNDHSPEYVFIPHDNINEQQFLTVSGFENTRSEFNGQKPPPAMQAASQENYSIVSSILHVWV